MVFSCLLEGQVTLSGTVKDGQSEESIPGVNILEKGTNNGTITDLEGNFTITVSSKESVLQVSYLGYLTEEIKVEDQTIFNVALLPDLVNLETVTVIGYGVQKKSVVTAAIASVSEEDISKVAPVRIDNALKGLAAGVTVTQSSGQPGASSQVRIRGIGTINTADPIYIVDGVQTNQGIDYIDPLDIQSIEVLKDAASCAVYGTRGANGVILITTKSGTKGKAVVSYDFTYGIQNPWRERDVLNATEYATLMNEGYVWDGDDEVYTNPESYGEGTDWQHEVFNYNAPETSHKLAISGGTDKVLYYLSASYLSQDGIVGGNFDRSNYDRMVLRSNLTFKLMDNKSRNYINKMDFGINTSFTNIQSCGITENSEYGSVLGSAIAFSPLLGVYADDPDALIEEIETEGGHTLIRDDDGNIYTVAGSDYNEITNPVAQMELPGQENYSNVFTSNFWGELNIWDNLKFRSSFGSELTFAGYDGWTPEYYLNSSNYSDESSVYSGMSKDIVWQLENVISYDKYFGNHYFKIMAGQSARSITGRYLYGYNRYMVEDNAEKANLDFCTGTSTEGDMSTSGSAYTPYRVASLFGRLSYNYNEKYMFQGILRRDGSTKFGPSYKYGYFPSVSFGWNITKEDFMAGIPEWLNTAKLRASWGKNGNDQIDDFVYDPQTSTGNNYTFGTDDNNTTVNGTKPSSLTNPDVHWEESIQTDVGLDLVFLNNAITFTVDYYNKKTSDMLIEMPVPTYAGDSKPYANVGTMRNSGIEFETNFKFNISTVNFNVGANAAYLKNKLTDLGNADGYLNLDSYQNVGTISRAENGECYPYFYGYKTDGIFQNEEEVAAWVNEDGDLLQDEAEPGDVRFVDVNGDGEISEDDRTKIGKGMPDWTYGFNLSADWNGFDFSMMLQGTVGNQIYDATRRTDISHINLPSYMLDRWHGEGTSNTLPRFTFSDDNGNWLSSDLFVKDGNYMRVKNVSLGYTIPSSITKKVLISKFRMYASAQNLLTFTKYEGFDPEISSGSTSLGVDRGVYPQARVYSFGVNVSF